MLSKKESSIYVNVSKRNGLLAQFFVRNHCSTHYRRQHWLVRKTWLAHLIMSATNRQKLTTNSKWSFYGNCAFWYTRTQRHTNTMPCIYFMRNNSANSGMWQFGMEKAGRPAYRARGEVMWPSVDMLGHGKECCCSALCIERPEFNSSVDNHITIFIFVEPNSRRQERKW